MPQSDNCSIINQHCLIGLDLPDGLAQLLLSTSMHLDTLAAVTAIRLGVVR